MQWAEVYAYVRLAVAADSEPVLDATALDRMIYQAQRADGYGRSPGGPLVPWAASHGYAVGARVRATAADGDHAYEVMTAGTSGGSVPTWPITIGGTVPDGTVTWQEVWIGTWAQAAAARDGWRLKASQTLTEAGSLTVGDVRVDQSTQLAQCLKMADYYGRQCGQTIGLPSPRRWPDPLVAVDAYAALDVLGN